MRLLTVLTFLYFQGFAVCPVSKYVSFSLVFVLIGKLQGKVFLIQFSLLNSFPQPYPIALRNPASPPLWHVHRHSWLCLRPNVLKAPARLLAAPRLITGSLHRGALVCGSGNPLTPALFLPLSGRLFLRWQEVQDLDEELKTAA